MFFLLPNRKQIEAEFINKLILCRPFCWGQKTNWPFCFQKKNFNPLKSTTLFPALSSNRTVVVLLCNAVARGLIQPVCGAETIELTLTAEKGKNRAERPTGKTGTSHGVSSDAAAPQDVQKALEVGLRPFKYFHYCSWTSLLRNVHFFDNVLSIIWPARCVNQSRPSPYNSLTADFILKLLACHFLSSISMLHSDCCC